MSGSAATAALFDLDDTLYPERAFVDGGFRAVGRFLAPQLGRSPNAIANHLRSINDRDGRGRLFQTLLADGGWPVDEDLVLAALLVYRGHRPRLQPFPGVVEGLGRLRANEIATGLVSDGLASVQRAKLAALPAVAKMLDVVVMTGELGAAHAKPSPVPFRVGCRLLSSDPARTWYVANDPRKDFVGAREAGLRTIRTGRFPDEGGATSVGTAVTVDADTVAESFDAVVEVILEEPA